MLGKLKHAHTMKNLDPSDVWNEKDPIFPGEMPAIMRDTDYPSNLGEFQKLPYIKQNEL